MNRRLKPFLSPLAISMGDPAGIGPDIILAAWRARKTRALPSFVVYGDPEVLMSRARALGLAVDIAGIETPAAAAAHPDALPVIATAPAGTVTPGRPSVVNAAATIAAIDQATAAVMASQASALVTAPINKAVLYGGGFRYPGHTEYLAHLADKAGPGGPLRPVMMLACDELKVVPVTIHIALSDVPATLTPALLEATIEITHAALQSDFGIPDPRIAVAGLNPHAGESGTIGTEDRDLIAPVIAHFAGRGFRITGPHPADTMFHAKAREGYDAVIAMYHDQALIPIKTLAFERGVNVTLGLPFVRTSPDHGTAYDIAGTGAANAESMIAAILMASRIVLSRAQALSEG